MKTLFHCTLRNNLSNILKEGLIPHIPNEVPNAICGVYLSRFPFEWMHWATDESRYAGALIEIDVSGLDLKKNMAFSHKNKPVAEFISPVRIPVERFVRISVSSDKNSYNFEEFDFKK